MSKDIWLGGVGVAAFLFPVVAKAADAQVGETAPVLPRVQASLHAGLEYATHGGGNYRNASAVVHGIDASRSSAVALPELSPGIGYTLGAGVLLHRLGEFGVSTTLNFTRTSHATTYAGNSHGQRANLSLLAFDNEVLLDRGRINPFFGISFGVLWLSLPASAATIDVQQGQATDGLDAVLHGLVVGPMLGTLCRLTPAMALDLTVRYNLYNYYSSSIFSFDGRWLTAHGWMLSLGVPVTLPTK